MAKKDDTTEDAPEVETVASVDPRQEAWDAFLARARLVNPPRFDMQKENHEFDKIPDNFIS